jgi:hypothetical protein
MAWESKLEVFYSGSCIKWTCHSYRWRLQVIMKLLTCHYTTVCISYGKSDLQLGYLHQLMYCLCPCNAAAFFWRLAYHNRPVIHVDVCCVVNLCLCVFIATHWTVTNWSTLEACLQSVRLFKVRADLNTLNHLEVIWSKKPMWNKCIIRNFLSVIHSYNQCSNETFYDFQDSRRARY